MPIYVAECPGCGRREDYVRPIAQCNDTPKCCGAPMDKIITPTHIATDIPDYQSPIDGRVIHGRKGQREDLARNNCRIYEGRESEDRAAAAFRADREKKLDAKIHEELSASYESMSSESKRALEFINLDSSTERG